MTLDTPHSKASEFRQHWRIGTAALIGTAVSFSVWPSLSSLFVGPLQETFGWSRGDIALAHNASLLAAVLSPALGRLIDSRGVRPVLLIGLCLTALAYCLLALLPGPLSLYYLLYAFLTVVGVTTTGLTFTRVVSGAFRENRGLALALTRSGLALAGAILPSVVFAIIHGYGWRMGFVSLAALIVLLAFPSAWFWLRGDSLQPVARKISDSETRPSLLSLLLTWKVVLICVVSALHYAPIVALLSQLQPLLVGKGLTAVDAAAAIGLIGLSALAGALVSGFLVDRIWAPLVACFFTLGPAVGCLLLMQGEISGGLAIVALILLGLGQGAEIDIVAFMIARYFGMRSYASIYGLSVFFIATTVAISGSLIGQAFDHAGNYDGALAVAAGLFTLAALGYLLMGRYPQLAKEAPVSAGSREAGTLRAEGQS